jgi:hypothetical protein
MSEGDMGKSAEWEEELSKAELKAKKRKDFGGECRIIGTWK